MINGGAVNNVVYEGVRVGSLTELACRLGSRRPVRYLPQGAIPHTDAGYRYITLTSESRTVPIQVPRPTVPVIVRVQVFPCLLAENPLDQCLGDWETDGRLGQVTCSFGQDISLVMRSISYVCGDPDKGDTESKSGGLTEVL